MTPVKTKGHNHCVTPSLVSRRGLPLHPDRIDADVSGVSDVERRVSHWIITHHHNVDIYEGTVNNSAEFHRTCGCIVLTVQVVSAMVAFVATVTTIMLAKMTVVVMIDG